MYIYIYTVMYMYIYIYIQQYMLIYVEMYMHITSMCILQICIYDTYIYTNIYVYIYIYIHMAVCQNLVPQVNIKIAGKWMFIPLKMVLIGIDPYPYIYILRIYANMYVI